MRLEFKYIGSRITIKSLRDSIFDLAITDKDWILLHPINFEDIIIEYRENYEESIIIPYILLGVSIKEDMEGRVPEDRIGIVRSVEA